MCKTNSKVIVALRLIATLAISTIIVAACTLSLRAQTETRREDGRVNAQASVALGLHKDTIACPTERETGNQEKQLTKEGAKHGTD